MFMCNPAPIEVEYLMRPRNDKTSNTCSTTRRAIFVAEATLRLEPPDALTISTTIRPKVES